MKGIKQSELERFVYLSSNCSYDNSGEGECGLGLKKDEYRKLGRRILKSLADILGLQKGEYDIRWNPGGIACSGDHTLHTDWFYLGLSDNLGVGWFFYRTCKGRKDYTGGCNCIVQWQHFLTYGLEYLANAIKRDCQRPQPEMAHFNGTSHFSTDLKGEPVKHSLFAS
jgi:hypothetical protein